MGVEWYLLEVLVIPTFCSQIFFSSLSIGTASPRLRGRGGGALLSDYVHRRLADREREVRVTTLCIPVHPSVVLGVAVFLHDPSAMFPCPVTLGWEIVMYFHCCWFLGTWSPFFGGSFNPAHASTLSFLVQFCLVHFFQYAICLLPGFWLTHIA